MKMWLNKRGCFSWAGQFTSIWLYLKASEIRFDTWRGEHWQEGHYIVITVFKIKILIYWSNSNSWIYFYIVPNKDWTKLITGLNKVLLVLRRRIGAHQIYVSMCAIHDLWTITLSYFRSMNCLKNKFYICHDDDTDI